MAQDQLHCLDILKEMMGISCALGLLLLIGACNFLCSTDIFHRLLVRFPVFLRIRDICEIATNNWTIWGKVLSTVWGVFSVASFSFFVVHTIIHPGRIVFLKTKLDNILVHIDLGFNVFFVIFFIIRYIGTNDKWNFVVSSSTWMEILTIGPALIAVQADKKQLLFSFLRALRLTCFKDLIFNANIVRRPNMKNLANIVVNIVCFWFVFAGIIYMTENLSHYTIFTKDLKLCAEDEYNSNKIGMTFFRCLYFLLVTASSVGYGDITPTSIASRVVIIIFVTLAVTFITSIIPEVYAVCSAPQNFGNRSFYTGAGEGHIIYCGSSQLNRLKSFFWNFYHNIDYSTEGIIRVCFLQSCQISEQIMWFLRSFCGRVTLVFGSPNEVDFLMQSCKLNAAEAIILTSEAGNARSEFEADRINYVRTIGLKLCAPQSRIIVQIKSMYHKQSFRALPLWRARASTLGALPPDAVLCDNQILLGLMGINSLAPGMATLLINLLSYRESQGSAGEGNFSRNSAGGGEKGGVSDIGIESGTGAFSDYLRATSCSSWRAAYYAGIKVKFYCVGFTAKHRDRSFKSLALEAFQVHSVLMVGVCMVDKLTGMMTGVINPSFDPGFIINPSTMRAFVVSRDVKSLRRFAEGPASGFGGMLIHGRKKQESGRDDGSGAGVGTNVIGGPEEDNKKASADSNDGSGSFEFDQLVQPSRNTGQVYNLQQEENDLNTAETTEESSVLAGVSLNLSDDFRPNEEHRLEDWYRDSIDARCGSPRELHAAEHEFNPLLDITGTLHWAPNRCCRKFTIDEARTINFQGHVLVAIIGPLEHPIGLSSLVLPLRNCSIPIDQLSDIVILGNAESIEKHEWRGIRNFPFIYVVDGNGVYPQHLLYCRAQRAAAMTVLNLAQRNNEFFDPFLADKMTLLCTENLRGIGAKNCHVTSELFYSPNAYCFSDPTERMADISAADVMDTQSFAEGLVVSSPNLTGLLASVFFCPESLAFLESIIHGSNQPSVDDYLSLDFCIPSCLSRGDSTNLNRVFGFRLLLLGADDYPLRDIFEMFDCKEMKWEDLLITCLEKFNIICLGVYRRRTVSQKNIDSPYSQSGWFVMTYPEAETQIDKKDKIFCLAPPSQTRGAQASVVIS